MLDSLKQFLIDLSGGTKQQSHFCDNDYRLAAAALLIHICTVDGEMSAAERATLHAPLQHPFALDDVINGGLIDAAVTADRDAIDLYHFTSLLNRSLDEEGRSRMVEMMWQMIYADGRVT